MPDKDIQAADRMTYRKTHPWITFHIDLTAADPRLWIDLGEAQSKGEHIAGVPLAPKIAADMHKIFLARGALATTAIEGNTLSEAEVRQFLDGELKLPPSRRYLGREIENIVEACNDLAASVQRDGTAPCDPDTIKWMNRRVLEGLELGEDVVPGEIRRHSVEVGRYRGAPASECEYLLEELCDWLNGPTFKAAEGQRIIFAIIKAIVAHLYIAWIHPFGDGNGRTARLLEYKILLMSGLPTPACHLLSNHYNKTKSEYYRQLDAASRSGGNILPFIRYALEGLVDGLREQIAMIKSHQMDVAWINYVHDQFSGLDGPAEVRRRCLVLDLGETRKPVALSKIPNLTPRLAAAYAGRTSRTLFRDVNELVDRNLITRSRDGLVANRDVILAFLPWRNREKAIPAARSRETALATPPRAARSERSTQLA